MYMYVTLQKNFFIRVLSILDTVERERNIKNILELTTYIFIYLIIIYEKCSDWIFILKAGSIKFD